VNAITPDLVPQPTAAQPRRQRRPWRRITAGVVAAAATAGIVVAVTHRFGGAPGTATPQSAYPTALATVTRQTLKATTQVSATLGYAGSYTVAGHAGGTITWLPATGNIVRQGGVLYRVDNGAPVYLLYGTVPAWRALSVGITGADVTQLNHDLVALGYADRASITVLGWDYFGWETQYALEILQAHLGLTQTGTLPLGQAVFLPSAIRVTAIQGGLGNPASGPVFTATSTRRVVTIALDSAQQTEVRVGDMVTITLPNGTTTPGVVSTVGTVATSSGSTTTIPVQVRLTDPQAAGTLDQAPVQVSITTATVPGALVVPVNALLAQPGGGYAVEEAVGVRRRLVSVTLGLFDDANGLVQVTGPGLAAGQRVVVPAL
jgi:hypothetical protein